MASSQPRAACTAESKYVRRCFAFFAFFRASALTPPRARDALGRRRLMRRSAQPSSRTRSSARYTRRKSMIVSQLRLRRWARSTATRSIGPEVTGRAALIARAPCGQARITGGGLAGPASEQPDGTRAPPGRCGSSGGLGRRRRYEDLLSWSLIGRRGRDEGRQPGRSRRRSGGQCSV